MKDEQIIEGNKLIAEFMKISYNKANMKLVWKGGLLVDELEILYHSSWDWLMPVVEKIESIKDDYHGYFGVHITSNHCTIQATNFRPEKKIPDPPYYFNCITLSTKIESTWVMVVNFIKWFNEQKGVSE